ncbi:CHAT domain-containing protein [Spirulina subsalsa FACHB-351]|uniref:CHAT domain-containing protein n=1 Tax=Spirulina subsalsa FACHB-351 TaxID=234711 RepID=A0ABT3L527_9CYAN|nr:CHAT domain-containing protein [Spirulina subsalsa]MCW6036557.1 CHAT domain-containing protein [Spirulina subsalsa FACHB-351]
MSEETPCLSLALTRLQTAGHTNYAIWVIKAPVPDGYVHHDSEWPPELTRQWLAWQQMFSLAMGPHLPVIHDNVDLEVGFLLEEWSGTPQNIGGRLMQDLGISLWQWLFAGAIGKTLMQSQGVAIGQGKALRLRLDIRDPNLIPLPWEIMQPGAGKQAISLNQQLLFSRTTSDVDPLSIQGTQDRLQILLVLGESSYPSQDTLDLDAEAATLSRFIEQRTGQAKYERSHYPVPTYVTPLLQPTRGQLIEALERSRYNVFFYAGHGTPAPDGGLLYLRQDATINGTELAQILVRNQVTLALFNACWGAQPDQVDEQTIPRSSLAEVLIHHGVPAVLAMRDSIADQEALSFIQAFTEALSERMPIDQAVAIARQQLLTLYKFNQPAWTLPILYMHPEFNGELVQVLGEGITELPTILPGTSVTLPQANLRSLQDHHRVWPVQGGLIRIGRHPTNDVVIQERWVSQEHAEIFYRETFTTSGNGPNYFLRDFSRYGTLIQDSQGWRTVHRQEIPLPSGTQIKLGSSQGQILEFVVEG